MRGNNHAHLRVEQHSTPTGHRRLSSKADIGKSGLGENAQCELDCTLNQQHAGDVGKNMLSRDLGGILAARTRCQDEFPGPYGQRRTAGHTREHRDVENPDGDGWH